MKSHFWNLTKIFLSFKINIYIINFRKKLKFLKKIEIYKTILLKKVK